MAIEPIKGFYVHDESTNTDGVAKYDYGWLEDLPKWDAVSGNEPVDMAKGYYLKYDSATNKVDFENPVASSTGYAYAKVPCAEGDVFIVNANGGVSPRAWVQTDSEGNAIVVSDSNIQVTDKEIVIRPGVSYLVLNDNQGSISFKDRYLSDIVKDNKWELDNMDEWDSKIGGADFEFLPLTGAYVYNSKQSTTTSKVVDTYSYIDVHDYDKIVFARPRFTAYTDFATIYFDDNFNVLRQDLLSNSSSYGRGFGMLEKDVSDVAYISTEWWHDTSTYGPFVFYGHKANANNISEAFLNKRLDDTKGRYRVYTKRYAYGNITKQKMLATIMRTKSLEQQVAFHGVDEYGYLQVNGTNLCSASGTPVQLKGVSLWNLAEGSQCGIKEGLETIKKYGGNLIRVPILTTTKLHNGYLEKGSDFIKRTVCQVIDDCIELGMYVLVDWHTLHEGDPNTYLDEAKKFFDFISGNYFNVENIIYEICNEPNGGTSWETISQYANEVIPVIRGNSPENVIVVGTPSFSSHPDWVTPLSYNNIMYTFHWYKGYDMTPMQTATNNGIPVFVTECGAKDAGDTDGVHNGDETQYYDITNYQALLDYCKSNKIPWVAWSLWQGNGYNPSTFFALAYQDNNLPILGGWNMDMLNIFGKCVFENFED